MNLDIALTADRNIECGLHVTLYSALEYLSPDSFINIHLFLNGYDEAAVGRINSTLSKFAGRYKIRLYDVSKLLLGSGKKTYLSG